MKSYIETLEKLYETNFAELNIKRLKQLGMSAFTNGDITVLLEQWDEGMSLRLINKICYIGRNELLRYRKNPWNAYVVICADEAFDAEMAVSIERDAASLRKLLVRSKMDLRRVPFFDDKIKDSHTLEFDTKSDYESLVDTLLQLSLSSGPPEKIATRILELASSLEGDSKL